MPAPKTGFAAQKDEEEWEALNKGEHYYKQYMKNKYEAQQTAQRMNNKKRRRAPDESLLREWQEDARQKHIRTVRKLLIFWSIHF